MNIWIAFRVATNAVMNGLIRASGPMVATRGAVVATNTFDLCLELR